MLMDSLLSRNISVLKISPSIYNGAVKKFEIQWFYGEVSDSDCLRCYGYNGMFQSHFSCLRNKAISFCYQSSFCEGKQIYQFEIKISNRQC